MTTTIQQVDWHTHHALLKSIRKRVFIDEQNITEVDEWDELDETALHFLAYTQSDSTHQPPTPIGTARLLPHGKITRMAVLSSHRNQGVGTEIIKYLIDNHKTLNINTLTADAQISALGFYEKLGFYSSGEIFMDAGIPHKKITLKLLNHQNADKASNQ